jgi:hypothetical protein
MNQKKMKFVAAAAIMFAASLALSPNAESNELSPGEGYYLGAFVGMGLGILQAKVSRLEEGGPTNIDAGTYETDRGGLGFSGIQGGGWAGWGMKTADDLYFGAEISGAGSDEKFELTSTKALNLNDGSGSGVAAAGTISKISAQRLWVAGGALRVGYYLNKDTLFSVKGGVAVSKFDVDIGSSSESYYAGGPQVGGSVETRMSKIDPNLSLRMEFVFTDYLTADILGGVGQGSRGAGTGGSDNTLTGHDAAGRIGVQYSF